MLLFPNFSDGQSSGGETPATPYLYYRIDVTAVDGGAFVSCDEIELNTGVGSGNVAIGTANSGATITASTSFAGRGPSLAFVGGAYGTNGWLTNGVKAGWIQWQDAGTIDVRQVAITPTPDERNRAPKDFTIQYSDNGSSFTTALTETGAAAWSYGETRVYDIGDNGDHKYWRLDITDNQDGGSFTGISCLRFILADGTIVSTVVNKAIATAVTRFAGNQAEDGLFDTVTGTSDSGWTSASVSPVEESIIFHLGVAAAIKEITWLSRPSEGDRSPRDFVVLGGDDLSSMTTLKTVSGETGWGSSEKRAFLIQ